MTDTLTPLVLDFLEWIAARPRPYSEVMDAWRTSCPRLTVWEDANERGFIVRRHIAGDEMVIWRRSGAASSRRADGSTLRDRNMEGL